MQRFAQSAKPSALSIIQNIVGRQTEPEEHVSADEKRQKWTDRVQLLSELTAARVDKEDAERDFQARDTLRNSAHFSKASGSIAEKLEEARKSAEERFVTAKDRYDTLLKEFTNSDFWPIPQTSDLSADVQEGLRHYYWQLNTKVTKVERQLAKLQTGIVTIQRNDVENDADNEIESGEVHDEVPKAPSHEEMVNKITQEVVAMVVTEMENRTTKRLDEKPNRDELDSLSTDIKAALTSVDEKFSEYFKDYGILVEAADFVGMQLGPMVKNELYPAVEAVSNDLAALKDHVEASVVDAVKTWQTKLDTMQSSTHDEIERIATSNRNLLESERAARIKLEATLGDQMRAASAQAQEISSLKTEHAIIKADNKRLGNANVQLTETVETLERQQASHQEIIIAMRDQVTALQQAVTAIQASSQPSFDTMKGELVQSVVKHLHEEIRPVMEKLISGVEERLNGHSTDVFTSIIAKLSPILKVNETLYALIKKHELSHLGSTTPSAANGSIRAPDGTPF